MNDKATCLELGMIATSATCHAFKPDVESLIDPDTIDPIVDLAKLIARVKTSHLDVLTALIDGERKTRKQGVRFGQPVYVRYRGQANSNYMSNFMRAIVVDARPNYVRVQSRDGSIQMSFDCQTGLSGPAVYDRASFEEIKERMIKKDRMVDPDIRAFASKRIRAIEEYELGLSAESSRGEVATIDSVFSQADLSEEAMDKAYNDLTVIASDIDSGYDTKRVRAYTYANRNRKRKKAKDETVNVS